MTDTRDKRGSAVHISQPWRSTLPTADSTIDGNDRRHAGLFYENDFPAGGSVALNARLRLLTLNPRFLV